MSALSIQTRDGSNPKNKPKLYVCCHPDDQEAVFPLVSKEIWAVYDATLCYDSEPYSDANEEAFFSDLRDMRMTVVVVTRRFLTEGSRAKDVILPFLTSCQLPVLPLMREPELDTLFAEVMGELQYLGIGSQDSGELPYEEKLKRFLIEALPDGDTIDKIRCAFQSCVFLSYRKVDRKYARELIRLIHRNDDLLDVAVWYDEFLKPGEDFNAEILEAIKKSDLFAMAVTPNIVQSENYIIKKEYPMAMEEKKPILPIEMHATDRTQLVNTFPQLPDCLPCENAAQLADALRRSLARTSRQLDGPEHIYLLGLAYLNGIDVEVDAVRGFQLIYRAAESSHIEACRKLVHMYWVGDGTPVDRTEALRRQETLINILRFKQAQSREPEDVLAYARALYEMATRLCELRRYADALPYAQNARALVDELCSMKDTPYDGILADHALLCAEIHFQLEHVGRGALLLLEAFAYMDYDWDDMTDVKRRMVALGLAMRPLKDIPWKEKDVDMILKTARMTYEESGLEGDKEQYARAMLWSISAHKEKADKLSFARELIALLTSTETVQLSERMSNNLAQAYVAMGQNVEDDNEKISYMEKALEISLQYPESTRHREAAAASRVFLAILYYKTQGRTPYSNELFEVALADISALARETKNADHYQLKFYLESMKDEAVYADQLARLKFTRECWAALCRENPGVKEYAAQYKAAKRLYRIAKVLSVFGLL